MRQTAEKLPDMYSCVDPAIAEILIARNKIVEQLAVLDLRISDVTKSRMHQQEVSLSLAAEEVARIAFQVRELALSIHRGIAKKLKLEVRI